MLIYRIFKKMMTAEFLMMLGLIYIKILMFMILKHIPMNRTCFRYTLVVLEILASLLEMLTAMVNQNLETDLQTLKLQPVKIVLLK